MRTQSQRTVDRRAGQPQPKASEPKPARFITFTLVAIFGVAAGSILGALAYRYDTWIPMQFTATFEPAGQAPSGDRSSANAQAEPPLAARLEEPVGNIARPPVKENPAPATKSVVVKKDERPAPPDQLTVASIIRQAVEDAPAALPQDSPRFGSAFETPSEAVTQQLQEKAQDVAVTSPPQLQPAPPVTSVPSEVDETESRMAAENAAFFNRPPESVRADAIAAGMRRGEATRYVSLRAGPNKQTRELAVIPANADILAENTCRRWCRVLFEGQEGYIYHSYFRYLEPEIVEVAESEAEVIAIENRLSKEGAEHFDLPTRTSTAAVAVNDQRFRWGTTREFVNLRAAPDNKAEVIVIVPANRKILTEDNCKHWCVAIYNGQQGFIYKAYIQPPG